MSKFQGGANIPPCTSLLAPLRLSITIRFPSSFDNVAVCVCHLLSTSFWSFQLVFFFTIHMSRNITDIALRVLIIGIWWRQMASFLCGFLSPKENSPLNCLIKDILDVACFT